MRRSLDGQQTELLRVTSKLGHFSNTFKKNNVRFPEKSRVEENNDNNNKNNDNNNNNNHSLWQVRNVWTG